MASKLTNTQILLKELIKKEYDDSKYNSSESDFFELFAASQILKNYELSDEELEYGHVGSGNDGGCDAIFTFLNNSLVTEEQVQTLFAPKDSVLEFCIIQSKNALSFGEDAIMKWKTVCTNLLNLSSTIDSYSTRYNENVLSAFQVFRDSYTKLITNRIRLRFNFYYVTLATELHPNVIQQSEELKDTIKDLFPNANTSISFVDADTLFEKYNASADNHMNLKLSEIPISPEQKKNYVALVDLKTYYSFIVDDNGAIRKKLFEANVRDYQGKNNVNNCISESLNNNDGEDFWWLNNGITILATEAILATNKELQISNPEIVNGLQTSTEICNYFTSNPEKLDSENRCVLVRVIVPESEEVRDNIIFATNNQTNIPKASLRVTDPIHLKIEMYLKSRGLYYDRRKNYYKNQGKKYFEIVSVSFLGQCLITLFIKRPDHARARPSTLLNDDEIYASLYKEDNNLEIYYKAARLGKIVQNNIKATDYSQAEKSDIMFYVLYSVVAKKLNSLTITFEDIISLDINSITNEFITNIRELVFDKYKELGGNGRVAKSNEFITKIEPLLEIKE